MISAQTQDPSGPATATVGTGPDVLIAAGALGAALRASPEFRAHLAADRALSADAVADAAIAAFGQRQTELRMESMLGTLTDPQHADLQRLQATMLAVPRTLSG